MTEKKEVDVVIIGAGLSGLVAAFMLKKQQISFVVLEAKNRPGGRIETLYSSDSIVLDMGAQWIGKKHTRILQLLKEFNLETIDTYKRGKTVFSFGDEIFFRRLPFYSPSGLIDLIRFTIILNKFSRAIQTNRQVFQQLKNQTMEQFLNKHTKKRESRIFLKLIIEELLCLSLDKVAAVDVLYSVASAGSVQNIMQSENYWIKEGAGTLIAKLTKAISSDLILNVPVTKIEYDEQGGTVYCNHQSWKTKKIIMSVPLNLQKNIVFSPPLPTAWTKLLKISKLPPVIKMNVIYEKPFWREKNLTSFRKKSFSSSV